MKKDEETWTIEKTYNELNFFRKTVSEHVGRMKNPFPTEELETKKRISELNAWLKEFIDVLNMVGASNGGFVALFNAFFKVNEVAISVK